MNTIKMEGIAKEALEVMREHHPKGADAVILAAIFTVVKRLRAGTEAELATHLSLIEDLDDRLRRVEAKLIEQEERNEAQDTEPQATR